MKSNRPMAGLLAALFVCVVGALEANAGSKVSAERGRQLIVLGFDGLEPKLVEPMIDEGLLPNFAALARRGGYKRLRTSTPPHSPVAWASIIAGTDPGKHGIFDWIHRDPKTYIPYLCTTETLRAKEFTLPVGDCDIPLWGGAQVVSLRHGTPFWEYLTGANVNAHVYRMPANYPPDESPGPGEFRTLTDMGTPDVTGSLGMFSFYTSGAFNVSKRISGGKAYRMRNRDVVRESFYGPPDGLLSPDAPESGKPTERAFVIYRDPNKRIAVIEWEETRVLLEEGEWSEWQTVQFDMGACVGETHLASVSGQVRLFLKKVHPHIELYATPIQIDPFDPAMPISVPDEFASEIAKKTGRYYTQGLPEDTEALKHDVLTRDEFLAQAMLIHKERLRLLDFALDEYKDGLLFFYFGRTDQVAHMFWGAMEPDHPAITPEMHERHKNVMRDIYMEADKTVGDVVARFPDATLMCISDHGFCSFRRGLNLNTWLVENGYAVRLNERDLSMPLNFNWAKTKAYAIGLNGLYVNMSTREKDGIVAPADKQELMDEIAAKLLALRDPKFGARVVKEVYQSHKVFSSDYVEIGPDMIVGYDTGYRGSWATGLGESPRELIVDNTNAWCGDHCTATDLVPGVVFSSEPIRRENPSLEDIAPTILAHFGIGIPPQMTGGDLLQNGNKPQPHDEQSPNKQSPRE